MTAATEQKQRTVYSLKRGKTKNTPFVVRRLHVGLGALTSSIPAPPQPPGWTEGHCHSLPGSRHLPSSFFPSAAFGEVDEMRARGLNQHISTVFKPWQTKLLSCPPHLPPAQHRAPGQHIPERNLVGWGLQASHHWGECCQAQGLGQLLHSVETEQGGQRQTSSHTCSFWSLP